MATKRNATFTPGQFVTIAPGGIPRTRSAFKGKVLQASGSTVRVQLRHPLPAGFSQVVTVATSAVEGREEHIFDNPHWQGYLTAYLAEDAAGMTESWKAFVGQVGEEEARGVQRCCMAAMPKRRAAWAPRRAR